MIGLTFSAMAQAAKTDPKIASRIEQCVTGAPMAFYDLKADPGQRNNLIADKRHAARIAKMTDHLVSDIKRTGDPELANLTTFLAGGKPVVHFHWTIFVRVQN